MKLQSRMFVIMLSAWIVSMLATALVFNWYAVRPVERFIGEQMVIQTILTSHLVDLGEDRKNATPAELADRKIKMQERLEGISKRVKADHGLDLEFWITDEFGNAYLNTGGPNFTFHPNFKFSDDPKAQPQAYEFWQLITKEKSFLIQDAQTREVDPSPFKYVGAGGVDRPRIVQVGYPKRTLNMAYSIILEVGYMAFFLSLCPLIPFLFVARSTIVPVTQLTEAADALKADEFEDKMLDSVCARNDDLGKLANVFRAMARDVTTRYSIIFEQIRSVVLKIKEDGTITYANSFALELFGYGELELVGHSMDLIVPPNQRDLVRRRLADLKNIKNIKDSQHHKMNENCTKDGDLLHMVWSNVPIKKKDGSIEYFCIGNDVTKVEQARWELLANISHDLRTPLHAISLAAADLLGSELGDKGANVEIILEQGEFLKELVNDILDLPKIEAGNLEIKHVPFGLRHCIDTAVNGPKVEAQKKDDITLTIDIAEDVPDHLIGDEIRLKKIVMNLAHNAVKFTDHGHVTVAVKRLASNSNSVTLHFSVVDTGVGIAGEMLKHFETSGLIPILSKTAGTGRGLKIVTGLVKLMKGKVKLTSKLGEGSDFSFLLSFPIAPPSDPQINTGWNADRHASVPSQPMHILLVDDNDVTRGLAADIIKGEGWTVVEADCGAQAINRATKSHFNVILMDVGMEGMDGFETTRRIRALEKEPGRKTRILALTAHATAGYERRCLEAGMDAFLTKPFKPADLIWAILKLQSRPTAPPPSAEEAAAGINVAALRNRYAGKKDLFRAHAQRFLDLSLAKVAVIGEAVRAGDWGKLVKEAHDLNGLILYVFHSRAAAAAHRLEEIGRQQAVAEAGPALAELETEIASLRAELTELMREDSW